MIAWLGTVLTVLLVVLGIITYLLVRNTTIPMIKEYSQEILSARSEEMGRIFESYFLEIRTVSRRDTIRGGSLSEIEEDLAALEPWMNDDFERLFFAGPDGNYVTSMRTYANIADREYFAMIMEQGALKAVSEPLLSRTTGEQAFVVAAPVYDFQGELIGLMGATVLLDTLTEIAMSMNIHGDGFGYIADHNSLLIAHPDESLHMKLNLLESSSWGYKGLEEAGLKMQSGQAGITNFEYPDGSRIVTLYHPIPKTPNWILGVSLFEQDMTKPAMSLMDEIIYLMAAIIVLVLIVVALISSRISRPLHLLREGVMMVSSGNLDHTLVIKTGDEIELLADSFNKMTADLKEHISVIRETAAEKERIKSELDLAVKIQNSMLPRIFPPFPDIPSLDLYAAMEPAREVGGDFYDFFLIDDTKLCFCIGDVSGKGIGAALFMVITRTILKNQAMQGNSLQEIFFRTNNMLCTDNEENMFVTVFMGMLKIDSGELEYICAGHNPPLISLDGNDFVYMSLAKSMVMGCFEDIPCSSAQITLKPGDALVLYTDGVTEAMDHNGELFNEERTKQALNRMEHQDMESLIKGLKQEINNFVLDTPASDDITMLALKIR